MKSLNRGLRQRCTAARLVLCVILVVTTALGLTTLGRAAGIITHAEVVERAIELLDEQAYPDLVNLLNEYREVVIYGSMFPDWAFTKFNADLSEVAHDTCLSLNCSTNRFRDALAAHLVPAFRNPQSEDDRKAIAFLFGLIAYQETDNFWHFSQPGSSLAFESALSLQNAILGTAVELVTELVITRNFLGIKHRPEFWYPADAIVITYKDLGVIDMTVEDLKVGKDRQAVQYYAEIFAAFFIFPKLSLSIDQPFISYVEAYPSGGLNNAAEHTAQAWQQTWDWLSTYTPVISNSLSPAQPDGNDGWYPQPVEISLYTVDSMRNSEVPRSCPSTKIDHLVDE
jgi:hypothetical protein